ncbi:MAG: ATP-binding protein [Boseongicola sp.]|nr:ATP-binding protein [Boseongicola sp.]
MALGSRPQERTLDQLFDVLGLDEEEYFLTRLAKADRILRECKVEIQPRLQDKPPDGMFLLRQIDMVVLSESAVREQLARHESSSQEFKSTYWCDLQRRQHQSCATVQQLRSEAVKHSALKSIAGFLTTGGGTLFIGVNDSGEALGLQPDLSILQDNRRHVDQLINNIKTDVTQRFRDGNTVNDYIRIEAVEIDDVTILRLDVTSRRKLTFLAPAKGDAQLFRRQDNRTISVQIYELEEFLEWRSEHILAGGP